MHMQAEASRQELLLKIEELENRLAESEQLIEAIKAGEVDAFAIGSDEKSEIYTLQSGDYAYRLLIEEFGEGAVNLTEDGLIVYTNTYFFELLQLPYERVVGSLVFDFIHEDSREHFKELFARALKGSSKGEINLAFNNNIIPVYISLTSLQPKLATVGAIITDLTEKKKNQEVILKYQKDLEIKNTELLQSNTELASFTYIASHDLKEPLRKIQIFSSRILDKEYDNFPAPIKDYFQRIITASAWMQHLIGDLLDYSRTNTHDSGYVPTDLGLVLEEVKTHLSELILENNVVIKSSSLPVLTVIHHQFNQLFSNLIINAIKYRRPGTDPVVTIGAGIVAKDEIPGEPMLTNDRYWKIWIKDNGIGFEQQYAEKIFELFQRLHTKAEYEGTGIGLAICKKIIQNHGGIIQATGEPGIGSTFTIYLPLNFDK